MKRISEIFQVHANGNEASDFAITHNALHERPQGVTQEPGDDIAIDTDNEYEDQIEIFANVLNNPSEFLVATLCSRCSGNSETLSENNLCDLCESHYNIISHRLGATTSIKRQAEEMLVKSNKKFKSCRPGQNVLVNIPDVDRSRVSPRNVLAVIITVNDNDLCTLATKEGKLDKLYSRNEFELADSDFLSRRQFKLYYQPTESCSHRLQF
jgi:hypothetical protein